MATRASGRCLVVVASAVCALIPVVQGRTVQQSRFPDTASLIESFAATGRADYRFGSREDALAFVEAWPASTDRWISAAPAGEQLRRTQLAALVAFELGRTAFDQLELNRQSGLRPQLVEAAWERLRRMAPSEFECRWLVGTIGFGVGLGSASVVEQADRAAKRFPAEGRFRLFEALMERDAWTLVSEPGTSEGDLAQSLGHGDRHTDRRPVGRAEKVLTDLLTDPGVGPEAQARLGWLRFHQRRVTESIALFKEAVEAAPDPFVRNLAALGLGLAHQSEGRLEDAAAAYRMGVAALPAARTSTTALALQLFLAGRRQEASGLLDGLAGALNTLDPWKHVSGADRFVGIMSELRSELGVPARAPAVPPEILPSSAFAGPPTAVRPEPTVVPATTRRPDFAARTSMVAVDAAVMLARRPLEGLTAGDFEIRDNGVLQAIESVSLEGLPLDVSVVLDLREAWYGKSQGRGHLVAVADATRQGVSDATQIASLLRADDRLRVVTATRDVAEPRPLQDSKGRAVHVVPRETATSAALHDAIFTAAARTTPPERRHLVLVFTDGLDGASVVTTEQMRAAAALSDALILVFRRDTTDEFFYPPGTKLGTLTVSRYLLRPHDPRDLLAIAEATGGSVERVNSIGESVVTDVKRTLESFRQRYVLRYRPTGVEPGGWHNLAVKVTRPGKLTVQARRGYFGG
jgi:VWFA-related protein